MSLGTNVALDGVVSHFWVATFPFFETTLFVAPPLVETTGGATVLSLFDADGGLVNKVSLEVEPGRVGVLELEQFLGECKLESGFRHGHLEVSSPAGTRHLCRLHSRAGAVAYPEATLLTSHRSMFAPVSFGAGLDSVVCLVNRSDVAGVVKVRLILGKRTPECFVEVPPHGARLVSLTAEFGTVSGGALGEAVPGYLRISTKGDPTFGVQILSRVGARDERSEGDAFAMVS